MPSTRRKHYESPKVPKWGKTMTASLVANVNTEATPKKCKTDARATQKIKSKDKLKLKSTGRRKSNVGKAQFSKKCKAIAKEMNTQVQARSSSDDDTNLNQPQPDCTEFCEGNQIIRMAMDRDDSFYETDSSSDEELDYDNTSEESSDDSEDEPIEVRHGDVAQDQGQGRPSTSHGREQEMEHHRNKIKEIDAEMSERILQLHQCLSKGGMNESVQLLEKCFNTETGKPKGKKRTLMFNELSNNNVNDNSNRIRTLDVSQSVETIYKNMVDKRNSSSSEDDIMELSGQEFDKIFSGSNVVDLGPEHSSSKAIGSKQENKRDSSMVREADLHVNQEDMVVGDELTPEARANQLVREAEAAKACIFNQPG